MPTVKGRNWDCFPKDESNYVVYSRGVKKKRPVARHGPLLKPCRERDHALQQFSVCDPLVRAFVVRVVQEGIGNPVLVVHSSQPDVVTDRSTSAMDVQGIASQLHAKTPSESCPPQDNS